MFGRLALLGVAVLAVALRCFCVTVGGFSVAMVCVSGIVGCRLAVMSRVIRRLVPVIGRIGRPVIGGMAICIDRTCGGVRLAIGAIGRRTVSFVSIGRHAGFGGRMSLVAAPCRLAGLAHELGRAGGSVIRLRILRPCRTGEDEGRENHGKGQRSGRAVHQALGSVRKISMRRLIAASGFFGSYSSRSAKPSIALTRPSSRPPRASM